MHINTADIVGVVCEGRPNDMNMYYSYLVTYFVLPINDQQKVILLSRMLLYMTLNTIATRYRTVMTTIGVKT